LEFKLQVAGPALRCRHDPELERNGRARKYSRFMSRFIAASPIVKPISQPLTVVNNDVHCQHSPGPIFQGNFFSDPADQSVRLFRRRQLQTFLHPNQKST
jgi:hypothetical protein